MSKDYLGPVTRALVGVSQGRLPLVADIANRLAGENGKKWHAKFSTCLQEGLPVPPKPEPLLTLLDLTITVPASTEPWVVSDHFKIDRSPAAELPISFLDPNFQNRFLGKIERPMLSETKLRPCLLNRSVVDDPIIQTLGGTDKAETQLREMHHYLKSADRTKWYIFYIKDMDDDLWALGAGWFGGGWRLGAYSVGDPGGWRGGGLVVARDC